MSGVLRLPRKEPKTIWVAGGHDPNDGARDPSRLRIVVPAPRRQTPEQLLLSRT
jgi:hypothetical protein